MMRYTEHMTTQPPSPDSIVQGFRKYSVPHKLANSVAKNLHTGESAFIIISGKMGAGKDTIAPPVMEALGFKNPSHTFFAEPLKKEVTEAITIIAQGQVKNKPAKSVYQTIAQTMGIKLKDAQLITDRLWEEIKNDEVQNAYQRTSNTRFALQHWGTNIRRTQDEDYWVRKALNNVAERVATNGSVFVTDARFPNEINAALQVGAYAVRLDISPEVQEKRIFDRDGIIISDEARAHPSETALDDFTDFNLRLDTDGLTIPGTIDIIVDDVLNSTGGKQYK